MDDETILEAIRSQGTGATLKGVTRVLPIGQLRLRAAWVRLAEEGRCRPMRSPGNPARVRAANRRTAAARDELIHSHFDLARAAARRFHASRRRGRGWYPDDCLSEAAMGLARAAEIWDEDRGVSFATYAKAAMDRHMQSGTGFGRPWLIESDVDKGAELEPPTCHGPGPVEEVAAAELRALVRDAVAAMDDRDRELLTRFYGLDGRGEETLTEIAASRGVTRTAIGSGVRRALERLRRRLPRLEEVR